MSSEERNDTTDRWKQAYALLDTLLDLPAEERADAVVALEIDDALREQVRVLLEEAARGPGALDRPLRVEPSSLAGTRLGRYEIESELGRGGSSVVYRARRWDVDFERQVALKVLTIGQMAAGALERFRREQEILARLQHPNVVGLLDAGVTDDGTAYLAMPLVDGEPIDAWCRRHARNARERVRVFLQVVDAIAFAQKSLIVHRDLKPGNVLVSSDGQVAVLDFGIAKLIDEGATPEDTSTRVLTPRFGAPEQWTGAPVTTATDVYALGATLYLLLCDEVPEGEAPARPSSRPGAIPGTDRDLDNVVLKALQEAADRRYDGAAAMGDDLRRWIDGRAVRATPDSLAYRIGKYVRRNQAAVLGGSLAIGSLVVAAAIAWSQAREAREQARLAETVTEFLVESFEAADPFRAGDEEVTAKQIVASGAERVDRVMGQDSAARNRMLIILGTLSHSLGDDERANTLLETALEADLSREDRIRALLQRGLTLTALGEMEEARALFNETLGVAEGDDIPFELRVEIILQYSSHMVMAHSGEEVAGVLKGVMKDPRFDRQLPPSTQTAAHVTMAEIRRGMGEFGRAKEHADRALELHERVDQGPVSRAEALRTAAGVYSDMGDLENAERFEREAFETYRERLGEDHPRVLVSLNNLALILKNRGLFEESAMQLRALREQQIRRLGPDHPHIDATEFNLGEALMMQGEYDEALRRYREAIRLAELNHPGSPWVGVYRAIYGRALGKAGNPAQAEEQFAKGLALAPSGEPLHPLTARLRVEYAAFLNDQKDTSGALGQLDPAVEVILNAYGEESREYALALLQRGRAFGRSGDPESARAALTQSVEILEASPFRGRYRDELRTARALLAATP